jgi:formylglycine-generating enzyme
MASRQRKLLFALGTGAAFAGAILGASATGIVKQDEPRAELGSCAAYSGLPAEGGETTGMTFVPGGTFRMGSDQHQPEERFTHFARVDGFWIDRHEVTNAQFKKFVDATGYVTLAERPVDAKSHPDWPQEMLVPQPGGPGSSIAGKENHPVVHIAYDDARAYAQWLGRGLPTEAQWEFAARGGRDGEDDWSSAFDPEGKPIANTWQGVFPVLNTNDDGYAETAPVGCFQPNGHGLCDMVGNVWEWTSDWYRSGHPKVATTNPTGPELVSLRIAPGQTPSRVIKGGSYLCSMNYCSRYRPAARQPQEGDLSAAHLGFRTVLNKPNP